jgi:hypothetical protein
MAELDWGTQKISSGESTPYMKLETGANQIRIVSKPYQASIHWENTRDGSKKKVICLGANCPLCKRGKVPQQRFQVLAINRKNGKVEILEFGKQIYNEISQYARDKEYGDVTKYDLKIKKEGSGRETKYTVIASPKQSELTAEEVSLLEGAKSLEELNKPKTLEEVYMMDLEALSDSVRDLEDDNFGSSNEKQNTKTGSAESLDISDDDWDNL